MLANIFAVCYVNILLLPAERRERESYEAMKP
jgi:hypothetical protein